MKISKLGSAGIKVVGAASCGIGSALTFWIGMSGNHLSNNIMLASSAGLAGSGLILLGQAARDSVDAFKSPSDNE